MSYLSQVRSQKPLIHNITNLVVTNFTANGLLALGASPIMAYAREEVADVAAISSAVVLNMGTLDDRVVESMLLAGKAANAAGVPVIFDPVGAGATPYRTETARMLVSEVKLAAIRGNVAEVANVVGESWAIKGVDAGEGDGDAVGLARRAASRLECIVAITGREDVVSDGNRTYTVASGHPILTQITGAGCLLSSVVGAFLAVVSGTRAIEAVTEALACYGAAAEEAVAAGGALPGSFQAHFLDQLAALEPARLKELARIRKEEL